MSKLLTELNSHVFISGQTRSGKTHFAARALAQLKRPVIFFNIQDEVLPASFMKVNCNDINGKQLVEALKDGNKIDLRFPKAMRTPRINTIIGHITHLLMSAGFSEKSPVYIAFDECHILKDEGLDGAIQAATRGLKRGCKCIFITQRPALCNKTLYTQSSEQYIFYIAASEKNYLKSKGLDYEECKSYWEQLGKYSYIYYDGFILEGRRAI